MARPDISAPDRDDRIEQQAAHESADGAAEESVSDLARGPLVESLGNADPDAHDQPPQGPRGVKIGIKHAAQEAAESAAEQSAEETRPGPS